MAEDSDNALLPRGGSLPAPVLVDPLNALNRGINTAQGMWGIREKQAQEAWGNILQQATDESGNVDYPKAQLLAKQAGPVVQMKMMDSLKDTSGLRGQQIVQAGAMHGLVGNMAASLMNDPSDANLAKIRATAVASGLPAGALAEIDRIQALPPEQRGAEAYKHVVGNLDALQQLTRGGYPTPVSKDVGGAEVPTSTTPGSPYGPPRTTVGAGGVTLGLTPAQLAAPHTYKDANGVEHQTTVGEYLKTLGTPPQPGGQPVPGAGAAPPAAATPPAGAPPVPPPPGTRLRTSAGTYPTPAGSPAAPVPAGATPPVPAAPPAPAGASIPGPAPGTAAAGTATGTASAGMATDLIKRADQVPTNKANYANMLSDLDRIGSMPAGGEREVAINTFLQKATGYGLTMNRDQVAAANSFSKLANIAVGQQLAAIGGTDARQALFMGSNPNLDLSKLGNQQIIHMLQGNEDAIQAKARAWNEWKKSGKGDDTYGDFQDDFNHHFDPRVFQQRYMGPDEVAALRKSLKGPGEEQKFKDDTLYARSRGWLK